MSTLYTIPCAPGGQANWTQRTTLDGRDYQLAFYWEQRDGHWYLSLADQDGVQIKSGIKLVGGEWPLLGAALLDSRRPPGELYILDLQSGGLDPGFDDLGGAYVLAYVSPN